ncbi:Aldo/keto reductase [Mycena epipterygia]|nr:Aldo/keto reductase [Mycena epipterygia]
MPVAPAKLRLGKSGLKISKSILGCMSYGSSKWESWVLDEEESIKHINYEAGIQTFDTANAYSNGMSEVVLDEIVVMTKVRGAVGKTVDVSAMELFMAGPDNVGYVNQHGLSRKHIMASVQASLKRLQIDYIDVLQCHRFDYDTPIAETMEALHDVVKAGYVRYIGMSSCYAWQFHVMQNYAIKHNLTPFISMQNQYSLINREEEREMMPTLKHFGVGSIPWSPLARGMVTRLLAAEKTVRQETDSIKDIYAQLGIVNATVISRIEELAKKHDATMAQIALAWVLAKEEVSAPIVGTTSIEKLEDLLGALDIKLTADEMVYLEEAYQRAPDAAMVYY